MTKKNQIFFLEPGNAESFVLKGIQIDQLLPREACEQFSAYLVRMEPCQIKKPSYHKKGEELYYVVSGAGKAVLDGNNYELKEGCFFRVPSGNLIIPFSISIPCSLKASEISLVPIEPYKVPSSETATVIEISKDSNFLFRCKKIFII